MAPVLLVIVEGTVTLTVSPGLKAPFSTDSVALLPLTAAPDRLRRPAPWLPNTRVLASEAAVGAALKVRPIEVFSGAFTVLLAGVRLVRLKVAAVTASSRYLYCVMVEGVGVVGAVVDPVKKVFGRVGASFCTPMGKYCTVAPAAYTCARPTSTSPAGTFSGDVKVKVRTWLTVLAVATKSAERARMAPVLASTTTPNTVCPRVALLASLAR